MKPLQTADLSATAELSPSSVDETDDRAAKNSVRLPAFEPNFRELDRLDEMAATTLDFFGTAPNSLAMRARLTGRCGPGWHATAIFL